jgi:hypothetical protein
MWWKFISEYIGCMKIEIRDTGLLCDFGSIFFIAYWSEYSRSKLMSFQFHERLKRILFRLTVSLIADDDLLSEVGTVF